MSKMIYVQEVIKCSSHFQQYRFDLAFRHFTILTQLQSYIIINPAMENVINLGKIRKWCMTLLSKCCQEGGEHLCHSTVAFHVLSSYMIC